MPVHAPWTWRTCQHAKDSCKRRKMNHGNGDYGLWSLVVINSIFFIAFAASFFKPKTGQDWRTLGMFSAFIVALFSGCTASR